jgi:hypothetical protein
MLEWLKFIWTGYTYILAVFIIIGMLAATGAIIEAIGKWSEKRELEQYAEVQKRMWERQEFMDKQKAEMLLNHQIRVMQEWNY